MNSSILIIQADGSEHHAEERDLPLRLGSRADSHIILPGADPLTAYIGDARGHLFIQPAGNITKPLLHNDRLLTESAWLKSNDRLRSESFVVEYRRSGERITFSVDGADREAAFPELSPPPLSNQSVSGDSGADIPVEVKRHKQTSRGKKIAFGFVAFSGFLLICAVLFVVLARPLEVQITPEAETISVSGLFPLVKLGGRYLGLPGDYTARISRQGYKDHTQEVSIARKGHNRLIVELEKLPGILSLDITPPDSVAVYSGDTLLGTIPPNRLEVPPGAHRLSLKKDRYQTYQAELVIEGGGVEQELSATLLPDWAEIGIVSEPAGAAVLIDSAAMGQTPFSTELLSGSYRLLLSKELFADSEQIIEVEAGADAEYRFTMEALPGRLQLSSTPDGAVVTIDSEYLGVTPLALSLKAGVEQTIQLSLAGYKSLKHAVELSPGEEKELQLRLAQQSGTVYLAITPAGAMVSINGKSYTGVQGKLSLPARPQTFEVHMPGYTSVSRTITPSPGFSQQLAIDLVPESGGSALLPQKTLASNVLNTAAGFRFVLIEPQPFTMGAPRREPGRRANERQREVTMSRPFLISEKPVTNADFRKFNNAHNSGSVGGYSLDGDSQPVVSITWNQAVEYLNWLSLQENLAPFYVKEGDTYKAVSPANNGYRLPTEAEWAYSARQAAGRQDQRYAWPGGFPPRSVVANLADESARTILPRVIPGYNDGFAVTAPVGSFGADQAGLYDIAGNVSEWCHDYYSAHTAGLSITSDPLGPSTGTLKVIRGSSWKDGSLTETRLSYRGYHNEARNNVGFRVARYP